VRGLSRLGFDELGRLTGGIWDVHRGIADRAFTASGPGARPAHLIHHAIANGLAGGGPHIDIGLREWLGTPPELEPPREDEVVEAAG
jgi:hypothetical protein